MHDTHHFCFYLGDYFKELPTQLLHFLNGCIAFNYPNSIHSILLSVIVLTNSLLITTYNVFHLLLFL